MREKEIYNIKEVLRERNIIAGVLSMSVTDLFVNLYVVILVEFLLFEIYISSIYFDRT